MSTDRRFPPPPDQNDAFRDRDDDAAEIRYSLTSLGEAVLAEADRDGRGERFRGFGPCIAVA